jgi:HAE1 family hydrophobic/amphiphilic exporter-1
VAQVNIIGGQEREIQVNLDATKMQELRIIDPQVQQIILSSNWIFQQEIFKRENKNVDSFSR